MLSVFQILFSGRPQGGGNAVRFLFPRFRALGSLKRGFRSLWKTLGSPGRGLGRVLGGWGVGCWVEERRKQAHEHQTSFKTMFSGFERPKVSCFTRNSQNVFSKTLCFYAPIWRKMRWHAGNSSKRARTRMPAHFLPNRSVKTRGFGKHVLLSPR